MVILHAGFRHDRLLVWAECSGETVFANSEQLAAVLRSLRVAVRENDFSHSDIALPSTSGGPIASSPLLGHPAPSKPGRVQTWSVPVAVLDPEAAIELLTKTVDKELLEPGVLAGTDLTFWASAMQFAGALVVRQHFLPDLTREDGKFVARWRAAYAGKDDDRLRALTSVMPGAARAVSPDVAQEACVRAFVDTVVDHLVTSGRQAVSAAGATLHDRWIQALEGPDRRLRVKPDEAIEFRRQLREWQRPIAVVSGAPYRLCFRLEAPAEDEAPLWQVRYLLQDRSDPSLLVPAELIWKPKRSRSAVWARSGFNPREHLLFSLGQASSICPPIDESLHSEAPSGYETDATGAFDFLSTKALALEEAGFSVMVPGWWSRKGTRARLSARARVKSPFEKGGGLSLNEVLDFKWEISMGGEAVTLRELKALADLKTPLVKFRGQWVHVSSDEVQAALNFWKKSDGQITAREAVQMAVGASSAPIPIEFAGVQAEGWIGELIRKLEGHVPFEELLQPQGLNAALRPYQVRGYSWLNFLHQWGFGACLADDMGLGKTIQTLSLILRDWRNGVDRPVLLVCPTSVVSNWQKEAARFTPELPVMIHHGAARAKGESFLSDASKHAMVVSSYSLLHRDLEHFKEVKWAGVILDEAQNIKNPETKQAAAARSLAADYRIALTGTPVENNVGDLWSMMEFLNPGVLGTRIEFKRNFYLPIQTGQDAEAMARLKRVTGPFILRRVKTDRSIIQDLPQKLEMKVFCTLTKEQASLYAAVAKDSIEAIESAEGIKRKGLVLSTLSRLKQVCNHPAQFLHDSSALAGRSGKMARLSEMLEETLSVEDRALIFTQFAEMGEMLQRYLQETFGRETLFLHGGVPKKQRDAMVERFQGQENGPPFFILSLKAGGTGLNLTRGNHVFHFDRWWNPAVENQATDRALRIGQMKNVQVHKFVCAGTLEEKIDAMIEKKSAVAADVVGTGETWLTELSTAQLKDVFALDRTAVGD